MAQPGTPGSQVPAGEDWISRKFADLDRELRELRAENILLTAGIEAYPDLVRIVGGLDVTGIATIGGTLGVTGPMTVGGTLATTGATTLGGDVAIVGTLSLPAGIIDNDALNSPVAYGANYANTSALVLTNTETTVASCDVPIPAGYSKAMITLIGSVGVVNPTAVRSSVAARVYIDPPGLSSEWGPRRYQTVESNADGSVYSMTVSEYQDLIPGKFTFRLAMLSAGAGWGATPGGGTIDAAVIFSR